MIDYEQLKIENQTYNEKVEERNEDLLKFNAKINSTGCFFVGMKIFKIVSSPSPDTSKRKVILCCQ